jgi:hypothetical protein
VNDSLAKSNVLHLWYLQTYPTGGEQDEIAIETVNSDLAQGEDFPITSYFEATYRVTPTVADPSVSPLSAFWTWASNMSQNLIELDVIETYGSLLGAYDSAIHNWPPGSGSFGWEGTSAIPGSYDPTQYHTYGMRVTSDGNSQMSACFYVDGNFISCQNPQPVGAEFSQRSFLILNIGALSQQLSRQTDMYVESVRVWSCPAWRDSQCSGKVLTSGP